MQKLFVSLLVVILSGCATEKTIENETMTMGLKFDANWGFCEVIPREPQWACLQHDDVVKLRQLLMECRVDQ